MARPAPPRRLRSLILVLCPLALAGVASAESVSPDTLAAPPETVAAVPTSAPVLSGRKYPPRIYRTVRLQGAPPAIDGRLDDPAWSQGEWSGDYTQQMPTEGAPPSRATELKILYDDENVYMAIRVHDDPAQVRRYPGRRDDFMDYGVDVVGVCFDSYNDKRTGFEFDLTAGGSKIDLVLGNGENEWDTSWDAVWDGEVAHDERGWTAEFRIPLNQLRYGPQNEQVWGMHAWRWIARNQEEDQWQLIPRKNSGRMYNLGELHGIRGLPRSRHLELLPHVVGRTRSGPETPGGRDYGGSLGLDAKVGLSSNFTLDATVNPDFGQVEADPSVVNLTAYETFYAEKRPFFLEGRKILSFGIEDSDQLFYTRRIGQAPSLAPPLGEGETIHAPENTTILGALKLTGKTADGLSLGLLQSLTQRERASVSSPLGEREPVVEPFGSYTVARVQKDWGKGNTSLGAMLTETHRWNSDPALSFLPTNALTGGIDLVHYFADRAWMLEARGVVSQVNGEPEAIQALQTSPVHYYQRPDASHLGVDANARSLFGHGGSLLLGTSGSRRLKLIDHFRWYSPGLELNDLGYLKQADVRANEVYFGWEEPTPRGVFRTYSAQLGREDSWDFGGLHTNAVTSLEASATFRNKWSTYGRLAFNQIVDTRALRGGPALRWHDHYSAYLQAGTDSSRRIYLFANGEHNWAVDDDSRSSRAEAQLQLRLLRRLSLSGQLAYQRYLDTLQYVTTAESADGPRWLLAQISQDTWSFTFRIDLTLTPDLTVQFYGSPVIGTGRYTDFKRATDTLAHRTADRFHAFGAEEIVFRPDANAYEVSEVAGASYSFANPDFSFRQFRSNLVVRWEYRPGSALYVVWSQGRTDQRDLWQRSFGTNWDDLWRTHPQNVFMVKLSYWFSP
jgi:hypothetical protein